MMKRQAEVFIYISACLRRPLLNENSPNLFVLSGSVANCIKCTMVGKSVVFDMWGGTFVLVDWDIGA
jgi:hypothetical protein